MGKGFTKEAYELIYKHPKWEEEANKYEEQLAVKLFHNSYTKSAVKTALGKISRLLTAYYGDGGKTLDTQQAQSVEAADGMTELAELFGESGNEIKVNKTLVTALMQGRRDNSGAGQVRKVTTNDVKPLEKGSSDMEALFWDQTYTQDEADQANMQTLDAIMNKDGNLREQMTLLYNGMFINGGYTSEQIGNSVSFKGLLHNIKRGDGQKHNSADIRGINYDLLEGLGHYQSGEDVFDTYSMARDLERRDEELKGKGNRLTRWWRGVKRALNATLGNKFIRKKRKTPVSQGEVGLGLEYYKQRGIAPSARESEFAMNGIGRDRKLMWKEGTAYFDVTKKVTAEGMLQTAGASGTSLRMLGAYRLMGASQKELLDFRLALIAWMVSSHDHSLYEILKGSHNAGVKGQEDLSEAAVMYTNIDPLDTEMLREHFAENKQFPHEVVYKMKLDELTEARKSREQAIGRDKERENLLNERAQLGKEKIESDRNASKQSSVCSALQNKINKVGGPLNNQNLNPEVRKKIEQEVEKLKVQLKQEQAVLAALMEIKSDVNEKIKNFRLLPELTLFANSTTLDEEDIGKNSKNKKSKNIAAIHGTTAVDLNAQDLALNIYTTGAYQTMNVGSKWWGWAGKRKLKDKRVNEVKFGSYQASYKKEVEDSGLLTQIYEMVRLSNRVAQDALEERGSRLKEETGEKSYMHAAQEITTFRGEKSSGSNYREENYAYETNSMTSTSKNLEKAHEYFCKAVRDAGYDKAVIAIYKFTGMGAVDITMLSKVANEQEVLVPIGTRMKVTKALVKNVKYDDLKSSAESFVSDSTANEETIREETAKKPDGSLDFEKVKHVNVVVLTEVDGPGARRRKEREANRDPAVRRQIKASLVQ